MRRFWHVIPVLIVLLLLSLAGLWTAGRLSPGYTLDLGGEEWGRIQNSNDWEYHGSYTYRWTRAVTRFRLPHLGTPRMLTVRLDGTRPEGASPAPVTLVLDGRETLTFQPSSGPALYQVVYEVPDAWRWETVVEVRTTPFSPPGDPRELGVIVDRLHFSPPLRPPAPPWLLVGLWAAAGCAAGFLGYALRRPAPWAILGAILVVVGLIALYAEARQVALPWAVLVLAVLAVGAAVAGVLRAPGGPPPADADSPSWAVLSTRERPGRFAIACLVLAVGVALLPLLAPLFHGEKSWALQMLEPFYPQTGFLPRPLQRLIPLLAVALAAVPAVNRDLQLLGEWIWKAAGRLTQQVRPAGRYLLLGLLFVPLQYLLRARILWGDGPSLIGRIGAGYRFNEPEMLPFFLHTTLYQWTERLWGWSVPDVYLVTSLVCGALYTALAAALADTLGRDRMEKGFIGGLLMTLATVEFGFGYLENYALVTVALLALFWQMALCLRGRASPAVVTVLWVLACACHLQALLVGPAVLYTLVRDWRARRWSARAIALPLGAGLLTAALLLGLFLLGGYDIGHLFQGDWARGNNPYMLVPLRSQDTYTLFSWTHLANLVNEHLLVAPVALPLLALVAAWHRRRIPWRDPLVIALLMSAAGLLLLASTLYPDLGAAMDWDLFAPAALPYTLLAGFVFNRTVREGEGKGYAALVLLFSAGAHAVLWVLMNAMLL